MQFDLRRREFISLLGGAAPSPRVRYQRSYSPRVGCLPEGCSRACVSDFKTAGVAVGSRQLGVNPIDISAAGICRSQNVDEVRSGARPSWVRVSGCAMIKSFVLGSESVARGLDLGQQRET
jgi:hypothetical protein